MALVQVLTFPADILFQCWPPLVTTGLSFRCPTFLLHVRNRFAFLFLGWVDVVGFLLLGKQAAAEVVLTLRPREAFPVWFWKRVCTPCLTVSPSTAFGPPGTIRNRVERTKTWLSLSNFSAHDDVTYGFIKALLLYTYNFVTPVLAGYFDR